MKKIVALVVALMLCLSLAAMAESTPSKTTDDMITVVIAGDNLPADANVTIEALSEDAMTEDQKTILEKEKAKLKDAANVEEYFGDVKDSDGNPVKLSEKLNADPEKLEVNEMTILTVDNYEDEYGNITLTIAFPTPYEAGTKVMVMVGEVTVNIDDTQTVEWTAFEGTVLEDGSVQVTITPEALEAVQNGTALLAVVNAPAEEEAPQA